ncbi:MAG: stage III sporulation protein AB [Ruminococcus sp.]|jgi:stage III sporulation protein AB|nr:stage III sporulation protein AB [Ruminococcus sp.]
MIKFICLAVVICSAYAVGIYFKGSLSRRLVILRQLRLALEKITLMIRYRGDTLHDIFTALQADSRLDELTFIGSTLEKMNDRSFAESYAEAVNEFRPVGLKQHEREIILGIGSELGVSDTEGQLSSLLLFDKELEALCLAAKDDVQKKSKLYSSLGLLSGVFAAILLI